MRVKQKITETPAQRILGKSDTDTGSNKKTSQKSTRTIFPLRYESDGLLLRELKPLLVDAGNNSRKSRTFFKDQFSSELEGVKRELKYRLKENDSYREKLIELYIGLQNNYFDASIYIDGLLEKKFDEAVDDSERKVILDMLMIGGDGYSNLLDRVLKNGEDDKRYEFCFDYLKKLNDEAKKDLVLTTWCDDNNKKTKNLVKALSEAFGEDYIINTINEHVRVNMSDDDLEEESGYVDEPDFYGNVSLMDDDEYDYAMSLEGSDDREEKIQAYFNGLEDVAERQKLLLAVLKNSEKSRTGELIVLFNTAVSWKLIRDSIETAVKVAKGNKAQMSEFFLEIAKNSSGNMHPAPIAYALNAYAYLNPDKGPVVLKEIVKGLDEPTVANNFVYSMLSLCGKEGKKAIKDVIKSDIKENRKSPVFFYLFGVAKLDSKKHQIEQDEPDEKEVVQEGKKEKSVEEKIVSASREILREIFSMDDDIASFVKMNVENKTGVVRECHQEWIVSELVFPQLMDIVHSVDIERYASWMMYGGDSNRVNNTRSLFAQALLEKDEFQKRTNQEHELIKSVKAFIDDGKKRKTKTATDFVKRFAGSI